MFLLGSMPFRLTHTVLAICLNLGTPQGIRTKTEEAFFDPSTRHHERSMRKIMNNLVECVENLQKLSILAVSIANDDERRSIMSLTFCNTAARSAL